MSEFEAPIRAIFLVDARGAIAGWNAGCADLFGLASGAALGHPATLLFAAGHAEWQDALHGAQPDERELAVNLRAAQGRILPASLALVPQCDAGGGLFGHTVAVLAQQFTADDATESERVARTPLSSVADLFPGTFFAVNRDGRFVLWNHNMERMLELMPDELAATRAVDLIDLPQRPRFVDGMRRVFEHGEELQLEVEYVAKSGKEMPFLLRGSRIRCDGEDYLFGLGIDITERRARETHLRLRERALHAASNGIVITRSSDEPGSDNLIEYVNPAFERITGYPADQVIGLNPRFMAAPGIDDNERGMLRDAIARRTSVNVVLRNLRKNGELFWNDLNITPVQDEHGAVNHFIGVINDVTALKQRTARLEHEVNHDALTGLANRNLMWDRLEQAVHLAQRQKSLVATVLIDLNNFKSINDTFGHEAGDVVLKVVARRLQASVRDSDTVARMSGDEFVLILANQPTLRFTLRMVERVRASFAIPVSFKDQEIPIGASVGVSLYPHDGSTATELVRAADLAMYHGKSNGRNDVHFFSAAMRSSRDASQHIETSLRAALERDELFLLYQPQVALRDGRIAGFEALLRWRHPELGVLGPARFLADAEQNGTIVQIGRQVLERACAFAAVLRDQGFGAVPVSVNVSFREYSQPGFLACLADCLARHRLEARALLLDLRIDGLLRNPTLGRELAERLRELGVGIAVDGFGAGMCDLGFLQQLAASQAKLAHAAVHAAPDGGAAVAKSLIDIAHNLDMAVVGDAVETRSQLDFLTSHGCDQVQGRLFSEPLGEEAARQMLREHQPA